MFDDYLSTSVLLVYSENLQILYYLALIKKKVKLKMRVKLFRFQSKYGMQNGYILFA